MNPSLCHDLEVLIDKVFDAVVPHKQYKIITAEEYVPCQRSVVHVHPMPDGYVTPFSDVDYDYKMQAIEAMQYPGGNSWYGIKKFNEFIRLTLRLNEGHMLLTDTAGFLWAYLEGARQYEAKKGPVLHMRSLIATYLALGWPETLQYEY